MRVNIFYKILLIVSAFSFLAVAIIFGVILPTAHYINKLNADSYNLRLYMERRYESIVRMRRSAQNLEAIKKEAASYPDYIFTVGDDLNLITALEDLAAKNKIDQKIKYAGYSKTPGQEMGFSVAATGDYLNVLRHLSDIEKLKYFLNIKQIQITPVFTRGEEAATSTSMFLNIGFYAN